MHRSQSLRIEAVEIECVIHAFLYDYLMAVSKAYGFSQLRSWAWIFALHIKANLISNPVMIEPPSLGPFYVGDASILLEFLFVLRVESAIEI